MGLMSGTSIDGVDVALIWTDGDNRVRAGPSRSLPYEEALRERLRACAGGCGDVDAVERELTLVHAEAMAGLLADAGEPASTVRVVGFHGHTLRHRPEEQLTRQIGDGALLAVRSGIDVICDFRRHDMAAGGQGAPLVPLYHAALSAELPKPLAVLNLGGVANVTWLGSGGRILAFDCGPGCALLDDWMSRQLGVAWDAEGAFAATGTPNPGRLDRLLGHAYFARQPPKSLDRDAFAGAVDGLSAADGAATLAAFTAAAVGAAVVHMPARPRTWLVSGGGRKNSFIMDRLRELLKISVEPVESVGWDGDALEAQAFAYLAVRSLKGWAITLPETTGVVRPTTGGALYRHGAKDG